MHGRTCNSVAQSKLRMGGGWSAEQHYQMTVPQLLSRRGMWLDRPYSMLMPSIMSGHVPIANTPSSSAQDLHAWTSIQQKAHRSKLARGASDVTCAQCIFLSEIARRLAVAAQQRDAKALASD